MDFYIAQTTNKQEFIHEIHCKICLKNITMVNRMKATLITFEAINKWIQVSVDKKVRTVK